MSAKISRISGKTSFKLNIIQENILRLQL